VKAIHNLWVANIIVTQLTKKQLETFANSINRKAMDVVAVALYIGISIASIISFFNFIRLFIAPSTIDKPPHLVYAFLISAPLGIFFFTQLTERVKKAYNILLQFRLITLLSFVNLYVFVYHVMAYYFFNLFGNVIQYTVIDIAFLEGNIRIIGFMAGFFITVPLCFNVMKKTFDPDVQKKLLNYEIDVLLPLIHHGDDTSINITICKDFETGEDCIVPEKKSFEHAFISGGTGSGKTATGFRPIIGQLFEHKSKLMEAQKKIAYNCLQDKIAIMTAPFSNEEFNRNFSPMMIRPHPGKEKEYKDAFGKYIIGIRSDGKIIHANLGITVIAPDGGLPSQIVDIGNRLNFHVHKVDPVLEVIEKGLSGETDPIVSFNPLVGDTPEKTADIIASILVSMEESEGKQSASYFTTASERAVRNLVILLKVVFPPYYKKEPTLVDILDCLNNFNMVVPMVKKLEKDRELAKQYSSVIAYFKASFFPPEVDGNGRIMPNSENGMQRNKTQEAIGGIINQLDNFLGRKEIRHILCNKDPQKTIRLEKLLENGETLAIATRQNNLGSRLGKAFALFFILSIQNRVLSRYAEDEEPEIPHFLFIDEFPFYLNDETRNFFTFARKYKCSVWIAVQNMGQLEKISKEFRETIFTNTGTKLFFPKNNLEDRQYISEFFGTYKKFQMQTGLSSSSIYEDSPSMSMQRRGTLEDEATVSETDVMKLKFKEVYYLYTDVKDRERVGKGTTDFLDKDSLYAEPTNFNIGPLNPAKPMPSQNLSSFLGGTGKPKQEANESVSESKEKEVTKEDIAVSEKAEVSSDSTPNSRFEDLDEPTEKNKDTTQPEETTENHPSDTENNKEKHTDQDSSLGAVEETNSEEVPEKDNTSSAHEYVEEVDEDSRFMEVVKSQKLTTESRSDDDSNSNGRW